MRGDTPQPGLDLFIARTTACILPQMSVLRTIVSSSRALATGAKDVGRFREIAGVFVKHGFGWFVAQLKLRRELQIDYEGTELTRVALQSPDTGKRLVAAFTTLGPTFVKLGQILSTRPDLLPESILQELTTLQDNVDPLTEEQVQSQLRANLGANYLDHFESFDPEPLASASIAQVHRAVLKDGTAVVLKIQRPGLRPIIQSDLNILLVLARYIEEAFVEADAMDLTGVIDGFAKSLAQEIDFRLEARNMERFRGNFADVEKIRIPLVFEDLSTSEVLCMELMQGRKFSEILDCGEDIDPYVETYFDAAYKMLFRDGFFHGDLHPGNVFVQDDGALAIIDCGMVGRLSRSMRDKLVDILYAVINEDLEALARTFFSLAIPLGRVDYKAFETDVIEIGERYLGGIPLSELQIGELFGELVAGATRHRVRMPTDFTMMFKAMITTEGLARTIAPNVDPIELARPYILEMIKERYSTERIKQLLISDVHALSGLARDLPRQLPVLIQDLQAGRLTIGTSQETLEFEKHAADARNRRAVRAAISMTALVCGTYTLTLNLPGFTSLGLPYISALFFAFASYGAWAMVRK